MNVKYTMSQEEIVEAMVLWLELKGYKATNGKFVCSPWNREVKAEFILRKR
ncbi:hypothetical protein QR321_14445 [Bacillus spizizenii]|uniref:hypothetical protein n=1 Tax=Bacillus subtilis TaxID=1423 RepID=UPI0013E92312|nr:hypothetical protein [Bacillus subtilis]WJD91330.1 hypothetical protein QR321_14445 [Bacillus spizizenii]